MKHQYQEYPPTVSGGPYLESGWTEYSGATTAQAVTTPIDSPTPDINQLYQQVTSQNPSFVDSLQNATLSSWSVFERPTYGCEMKSDGLHVHIKDTGHYGYCTSGRGSFSNFAFLVQMKF